MSDNHMRVGPIESIYQTYTMTELLKRNTVSYPVEKKTIEQNEPEIKEIEIVKQCRFCNHFKLDAGPMGKTAEGYYGICSCEECNCEEFRSKVISKGVKDVHSHKVFWRSMDNVLEVSVTFCCEYYELKPDVEC